MGALSARMVEEVTAAIVAAAAIAALANSVAEGTPLELEVPVEGGSEGEASTGASSLIFAAATLCFLSVQFVMCFEFLSSICSHKFKTFIHLGCVKMS